MKTGAAGYTEWLLFHLWKPDDNTGMCCPYINLTDTIIYRWAKPFFWYYTLPDGEIVRRSKTKVNHKFIYEEFIKTEHKVIATYMSFGDSTQDKGNQATVEFFSGSSFDNYIHNREKSLSGILQKWVQPKGKHNYVIKATWSSQFCLLERRKNIHELNDTKVDYFDKLVTYEGLEQNTLVESLAVPQLVYKIQQICIGIVDHVRAVTAGNVTITQMNLFFKQDENDKVWLLFCSYLKVLDVLNCQKFENIQELQLTVPQRAKQKEFESSAKIFELSQNRDKCVGCNKIIRKEMFYPMPLKMLLECYKHDNPEPPNLIKQDLNDSAIERTSQVPPILVRMNNMITNQKYQQLKKDLSWGNQEISICENCYLHYSSYHLGTKKQRRFKAKYQNKPKLKLPTDNFDQDQPLVLTPKSTQMIRQSLAPKQRTLNRVRSFNFEQPMQELPKTSYQPKRIIYHQQRLVKTREKPGRKVILPNIEINRNKSYNIYSTKAAPSTAGSYRRIRPSVSHSSTTEASTKFLEETIQTIRNALMN